MTETQQTEEMKRYLFYEMSAEESDALEEQYFEDSELFYDLLELENDLIDRYAVGKLQGEDLVRFEKSLEKSPERREKIADARVLQIIIAEEKSKREIAVAAPTFWEKLSSFFTLQMSGLKLAAGAIALLLICSAAFLLYKWQKQNEFAEIERQRETERNKKENIAQLEQKQTEKSNIQQSDNSNANSQQNDNNQKSEEGNFKKETEKPKKDVEEKKTDIPPSNRNEIKPSKEFLAVSILPFGSGVRTVETENFNPTAKIGKINGEQRIILGIPVLDKNYTAIKVISKNGLEHSQNIPEGAKFIIFDLPPNDTVIEIRAKGRDIRRGWVSLGWFELKVKKNKK